MPTINIEVGDPPTTAGELVSGVVSAVDTAPAEGPRSVAEDLVPIVLFLAIALTYCVKYYFAYRTRQEAQSTVRVALERGDPLTPEVLDRLIQAPPRRNDLRRGVIGICLGIGLGTFGFLVGEPDAVRPMLAVGLVPLLLGLAYLVLARLGGGQG